MATGWNEVDDEVADLITSLEVGDIVESDLVRKMWIIEVSERTINIGDTEDQDVLWITGETPRGGEYSFYYWRDPRVRGADGEVRDWDHAVHTKRYRRGNNTWMNSSDDLTELEKVGELTGYEVMFEGHFGDEFEADDAEAAQKNARTEFSTGEFDLAIDNDPTVDATEKEDGVYGVHFTGYATKTVMAEDWKEAMSEAEVTGSADCKERFVVEVTNKDTGEQHQP